MRKYLVLLVVAIAAMGVFAASASATGGNGEGEEPPPPVAKSYCGGGENYSTSDDFIQGFLDMAIAKSGGVFVFGFTGSEVVPFEGGMSFGETLTSMNTLVYSFDPSPLNGVDAVFVSVSAGACSGAGAVSVDRQFFVCTGDTEPTVMSRGSAKAGVTNKGWFWPYAVPASAGLGKTIVGSWTLTCRLPAGWVQGDLAVSTGGGETYGGAVGSGLLKTNPGDYVPNYHG